MLIWSEEKVAHVKSSANIGRLGGGFACKISDTNVNARCKAQDKTSGVAAGGGDKMRTKDEKTRHDSGAYSIQPY